MRLKSFVILTFVAVTLSAGCNSRRSGLTETKTQPSIDSCYWDIPYSNGGDCFPGFEQEVAEYDSMQVDIYNRWGQRLYHSMDWTENWLCNSAKPTHVQSGTYFYIVSWRADTGWTKYQGTLNVVCQ